VSFERQAAARLVWLSAAAEAWATRAEATASLNGF
jgi:hypothetical protein